MRVKEGGSFVWTPLRVAQKQLSSLRETKTRQSLVKGERLVRFALISASWPLGLHGGGPALDFEAQIGTVWVGVRVRVQGPGCMWRGRDV